MRSFVWHPWLRHPLWLALAAVIVCGFLTPVAQGASMIPPLDTRPKDFAFIKKDGVYHLFYIRHNDFLPSFATEIDFGHAVSTDLYHWTQLPPVVPVDPTGWDNLHVWAPHIVQSGGLYWMFYTGLTEKPGQFSDTQRIGVVVSSDLMTWNKITVTPVWQNSGAPWAWWSPLRPAMACRDPFVMPDPNAPGRWLMYYTATPESDTLATVVGVARSPGGDLTQWVDEKPLWITHRSFSFNPSTESPHLFRHGDRWFLIMTTSSGQPLSFFTTDDPLGDPAAWIYRGRLRNMIGEDTQLWIASELLQDGDVDLLAYVNFNRIDIRRVVWGTGDNFTLADPAIFHMISMDWMRPSVREGDPIGLQLVGANRFAFTGRLRAFVRRPDGSEFEAPTDSLGLDPRPVLDRDTTVVGWYPRRWPTTADTTTVMVVRVATEDATASTNWLTVVPNPRPSAPRGNVRGGTIEDPPAEEFPPPVPADTTVLRPQPLASLAAAPRPGTPEGLRVLRAAPIGGPHTLAFELPQSTQVRLEVFDLAGRRLATLADGPLGVGAHVRVWDGRDASGTKVPRGLVFARLSAGAEVRTARILIER